MGVLVPIYIFFGFVLLKVQNAKNIPNINIHVFDLKLLPNGEFE